MQKVSQSSRSRAYAYIRDEVLSDPALHGSFVTEEEVAARVGVSRTPVREAFILLAAEGLIDLVPRHGAYIPPVTREEIDDVLQLRAFLECKAAELVLARGRAPIEAMEAALRGQAECSGDGQEKEFTKWDTEFHLAMVRAANNSLMTRIYADLRARHIRIGIRALMATEHRQDEVMAEHQAIIDALRTGNLEAVNAELLRHIDNTVGRLRDA